MLTVVGAIQSAVPIARAELLDALQVKACNRYSKLDLAEQPTLFLEFHGTKDSVAEQVERFAAIAGDCSEYDFRWASSAEERSRLLAGASRCLVGSDGAASGFAGRPDRHLRPDIDVPGGHLADAAGFGRVVADCTALRPRRRR